MEKKVETLTAKLNTAENIIKEKSEKIDELNRQIDELRQNGTNNQIRPAAPPSGQFNIFEDLRARLETVKPYNTGKLVKETVKNTLFSFNFSKN